MRPKWIVVILFLFIFLAYIVSYSSLLTNGKSHDIKSTLTNKSKIGFETVAKKVVRSLQETNNYTITFSYELQHEYGQWWGDESFFDFFSGSVYEGYFLNGTYPKLEYEFTVVTTPWGLFENDTVTVIHRDGVFTAIYRVIEPNSRLHQRIANETVESYKSYSYSLAKSLPNFYNSILETLLNSNITWSEQNDCFIFTNISQEEFSPILGEIENISPNTISFISPLESGTGYLTNETTISFCTKSSLYSIEVFFHETSKLTKGEVFKLKESYLTYFDFKVRIKLVIRLSS